jgi:hypothetical protein
MIYRPEWTKGFEITAIEIALTRSLILVEIQTLANDDQTQYESLKYGLVERKRHPALDHNTLAMIDTIDTRVV